MKQPRRFPSLPTAAVVLTAVICMVLLGFWQLDRMHQKEQRLASIAQKSGEGAISLDALKPQQEDIRDYQVGFNGRAESNQILFLDNRVQNGKVGYEVLVPVQSTDGTVLVNFGWVAAPSLRSELPEVDLAQTYQHFHGRISIPGHNPVVRETLPFDASFPVVIQAVDLDFIRRLTGKSLLPYVVELTAPEQSEFIRDWQPVVMPPEKHFAYAIQWFGLAVAAAAVSYFSLISNRKG